MKARILLSVALFVASPALALAHGLHQTFDVNGSGNFQSSYGAYYSPVIDPVGQDDSVFETGSYTVASIVTPSLQFTAAFAPADRPAPNGSGNIAVGSTYGFDIVGPLLFWDPVLGVTPTAVTATIVRSGTAFTVDQLSGLVPGGNLATLAAPYNGTAGFHNAATVNIPIGSPAGLYVVGFQVRSTNTTTYGTSNTFYAIGTNGLSDEDFYRGIEALDHIGVPEPSSIALAGVGAAGLAWAGWRRRRAARAA